MKKVLLIIGIIAAVIAVAYFGLQAWVKSKVKDETSRMSPLTTQKFSDIYALGEDFVDMYLVKTVSGYAAVDACMTPERVKSELDKLGIKPEEIKYVFLTHTDHDHVGALPLFKNAKIYISAQEKQMVDGTTARGPMMHNSIPDGYLTMSDGETVNADGINIKGVLTPGHTPGSMCFTVSDSNLVTGDAMAIINGKAEHFNEFFTMDMPTHMQSIKKLAALQGIKHVYTAHYGLSNDFEGLFK